MIEEQYERYLSSRKKEDPYESKWFLALYLGGFMRDFEQRFAGALTALEILEKAAKNKSYPM